MCTNCGKEMDFVEGDIIYGENWYHATCWKTKNEESLMFEIDYISLEK
jgi:hypothetical protein